MSTPLPATLNNPSSLANSTSGAAATPPSQTLSASDFLQILVAEFQNQDPTAPSDPTQYATQMVEFSNLGQLQNIDSTLQQSPSQQLMQASSAYIGRDVVASGSAVGVKGGKATSIEYAPPSTDSYTALVFDSSGHEVDSVSLGSLQAGSLQTFSWQPSSSVGDGTYTAKIVNSKDVAISGLLEQGVVQNVTSSSNGIVLDLGNLQVTENQVTSVAQP
jgi:flagellar basal-body rod modification protein FlgD